MAIDMSPVVTVGGGFSAADGTPMRARGGRGSEQIVSELMAPYYEAVRAGIVFGALAQTVTAPVIWSTAAGSGGPFVYNGSTTKNLVLLAAGFSTLVASAVAGTLGIATGLTALPTSLTAADARWNAYAGGAASQATPYRIATPSAAATSFFPLIRASTTALTAETGLSFIETKGLVVVPPGGFMTVAGSATLTTLQMAAALIWMEVPV